jgi:hypothetical protein
MLRRRILSHHFLRRRARTAERRQQEAHPGAAEGRFVVERALRGPYRWYVVERPRGRRRRRSSTADR